MPKNAAVTVRLPLALKQQLEQRARAQRRSVSAQIVHDLEALAAAAPPAGARSSRPLLGRFDGGRVPTDADIEEARTLLWGGLDARRP